MFLTEDIIKMKKKRTEINTRVNINANRDYHKTSSEDDDALRGEGELPYMYLKDRVLVCFIG